MKYPADPLPTFRDWGDRLVFLIAEYKIPISATILAGGLFFAFGQPETPDPPDGAMSVLASVMLLSMPSFFVGLKIVDWLFDPRLVHVGVVLPGHDVVYRMVKVPPAIWEEKTVDGAAPLPVDEGWADVLVTDLEWLGDVGELTVRGCERSMMQPGEAVADAEKVEEYYQDYLETRNDYAKLYATVASIGQDAHDDGLLAAVDLRDKTLAPGVALRDLIDDRDEQLADLPSLDEIGHDEQQPEPDLGHPVDPQAVDAAALANGGPES